MKKILFTVLCLVLAFGFISASMVGQSSKNVLAEEQQGAKINFLVLGDSIADGYGLSGYEAGSYEFVSGSFADNVRAYLNDRAEGLDVQFSAKTLAMEGDDTSDFLNKLNNNTDGIVDEIKKANIVVLSIGANDILGPVVGSEEVGTAIIFGSDDNVDTSGVEQLLDSSMATFRNNFANILTALSTLNNDAYYIFMDVYNPYAEFITTDKSIALTYYGMNMATITPAKFHIIGNLAERYLNQLNEELYSQIYAKGDNGSRNYNNMELTGCGANTLLSDLRGVKYQFDNYLKQSNSNKKYNDIVNADILEYSSVDAMDIVDYLDPHPTVAGHTIIGDVFESSLNNLVFVKYVSTNPSSTIQSYLNIQKKGEVLDVPLDDFEIITGYGIVGVCSDVGLETLVDDTFKPNQDVSLYIKWGMLKEVRFVTYSSSVINYASVIEGGTVKEPEKPVSDSGDLFVYWYYINGEGVPTKWNFKTDIVTDDISLYALWASITCNNAQNLTQKLSLESFVGMKEVEFTVGFGVAVSSVNMQWYVNDKLMDGAVNSTFKFAPEAKQGKYEVYCIVNGGQTKSYTVEVTYGEPSEFTIRLENISKDNVYTFTVEFKELYRSESFVWYFMDGESQVIAQEYKGSTIQIKLPRSCSVYAIYNGETRVKSNSIEVEVAQRIDGEAPIMMVAGVTILVVVVVLLVVSLKRFRKYY